MVRKKQSNNRKKMIISLMLAFFMITSIGSVFLYYGNDESADPGRFTLEFSGKEYDYQMRQDPNGMTFYTVETEGDSFMVYSLPSEIYFNDIEAGAIDKLIRSSSIYVTFDPDDEELALIDWLRFELNQNTGFEKTIISGVSEESELYPLPVITCEDATESRPVLFLMTTNTTVTEMTLDDNCINLSFPRYQVYKVRDLLIYSIKGINI